MLAHAIERFCERTAAYLQAVYIVAESLKTIQAGNYHPGDRKAHLALEIRRRKAMGRAKRLGKWLAPRMQAAGIDPAPVLSVLVCFDGSAPAPDRLRGIWDGTQVALRQAALRPGTETGADNGADGRRKKTVSVPNNIQVLRLAKELEKHKDSGRSMNDIALDFTNGDAKRAASLLRGVRRFNKDRT